MINVFGGWRAGLTEPRRIWSYSRFRVFINLRGGPAAGGPPKGVARVGGPEARRVSPVPFFLRGNRTHKGGGGPDGGGAPASPRRKLSGPRTVEPPGEGGLEANPEAMGEGVDCLLPYA